MAKRRGRTLALMMALALTGPLMAEPGTANWRLRVEAAGVTTSGPLREEAQGLWRWQPDHPGCSASLHVVEQGEARAGWLEYAGPAPDADQGMSLLMDLPRFGRGLSIGRFKPYWTAPSFTSDPRTLAPRGLLLLWRQSGPESPYHVLLPLSGGDTVGELGNHKFAFGVHLSTGCQGTAIARAPVFAEASGPDPYALAPEALRLAQTLPGAPRGKLRTQKPFPEPFRYLGWCSWNTYYQQVSADKVLASVSSLRAKGVPIRWVLVDDGWMTLQDKRLAGWDATQKKFPGGLGALVRTLKERHGIRWVGVWHTLQGYWDGVAPGLSPALLEGREGLLIPDPGRAEDFFAAWYQHLAAAGISFVKVDNQARNWRFTEGIRPLFAVSAGLHAGLERAAQRYLDGGVLNCMDMAPENAFNWESSNLARNSEDYIPEDPQNPPEHVLQNTYSAFWTSNFAYPDYDMFETHHAAADFHAVARAISGGPVYTTDTIGSENAEALRAFCLEDGLLLRLDAPGQVTRDCLLLDPSLEPVPLKVAGRVGEAAMLAAFNVNKTVGAVSGTLRCSDAEGLQPGEYAYYARMKDEAGRLAEPLSFGLEPRQAELFTIAPLRDGVAVFGLLDKMVGPAALGAVSRQAGEVAVEVKGSGVLGVYTISPPSSVEGAAEWSYRSGLLRARLERAGVVRIRL
jgi:hypothetical protein